jgi:dihydroorotate dehydrogenase (fumarate)
MSVDLRTRYLGLELRNPVVASASPLTGSVESMQRLQDAGVAAVVLPSLFEEHIEHEEMAVHELMLYGAEVSPEAQGFFPEIPDRESSATRYLRLIEDAKQRLQVPVIASLNGATPGGWTRIARQLQDAGADAIELNVYFLATSATDSSAAVEDRYLSLVTDVRSAVTVPVAVKVAPFFSAMASMAQRLVAAGAAGLVLFNRFLQPDIVLDDLSVAPRLVLSTSDELRLALRWIAILHGRVDASLAATGGAHTVEDLLKLLLAGADCALLASSLLQHGPAHATKLLRGVEAWLAEREYTSVAQMKGSLSQRASPDPAAFERANYMQALQSYTSEYA